MPITPTYPGVYIEEVSSGVRTITGVATSIAAFFGRTQKGPIDKAVRCLSYSDFLRNFGGAHPLSDLGASVKQFFTNGGTDCYVVRLASGAGPASVTLRNGTGAGTYNVLIATAKCEGAWGQDVKLSVDYNTTNPDDSFNLTITQETDGSAVKTEVFYNLSMNPNSARFAPTFVTQSSKLIDLAIHSGDLGDPDVTGSFMNQIANTPAGYSQSRRVFTAATSAALRDLVRTTIEGWITAGKSVFTVDLNGKSAPVDLSGIETRPEWTTPSPNNVDGLLVPLDAHINAQLAITDPALSIDVTWDVLTTRTVVLCLTSNSPPYSNVTIARGDSKDISTDLMLGIEAGGIEAGRYSNLRPVPNGLYFSGGDMFSAAPTDIDDFALLAQDQITSVTIGGVAITVDLATTAATEPMYNHANGGTDGIREKLGIIKDAVNADANSPCTAEVRGYHLGLKLKTGSLNDTSTIVTTPSAAFGTGCTANVRQYSLGVLGTGAFQSAGTAGSDGNAPGQTEYEGDPDEHTGFYALDRVDLFNLMILPADREYDVAKVKGTASTYCVSRRAFLLLDAPADWTKNDHPNKVDATKVNDFRIGVSKQHSAIFYPRVEYSDAGIRKLIGPSGMIAGLMARTDSQRGVWKAPAGIEADLRGLTDLEINMTDNENGVLNKLGVNCLRKFPNGIVSWGARTLDGADDFGSEWKYIPIRRLALFLEESLFRATKWVVFEPNDEPLWAKIRMNINAFMMRLFRQGAFQGSTPDKAFFVRCDGETTTATDRNLGIVNIEVGFAPLKPAEFVIIKIQQIPDV